MGKRKFQWGVDNKYKIVLSQKHPFFDEDQPVHGEYNPFFYHLASFYSPPFTEKRSNGDWRSAYSAMKRFAFSEMKKINKDAMIISIRFYDNQINTILEFEVAQDAEKYVKA